MPGQFTGFAALFAFTRRRTLEALKQKNGRILQQIDGTAASVACVTDFAQVLLVNKIDEIAGTEPSVALPRRLAG
jgi:hypothetical protein